MNYQAELIGILGIKPEYFKKTMLRKEFFNKEYSLLFEFMEKSFNECGVIDHQYILENNSADGDLYLSCVSNVIRTDEDYFSSLELHAIDKYKRQIISINANKLIKGDIELNDFKLTYENVIDLGKTKSSRVDKNGILKILMTENKKLEFKDFKRLKSFGKIKEHDLVIVAGKTGIGKTGFALNLLNDLSASYPCLYFNLEMSYETLIHRLVALNTLIKIENLEKYSLLPQKQIEKINNVADELDRRNIEVVNTSQSIEKIRSDVAMHDQSRHFIVFIDHLGLISARGRTSYEIATKVAKELRKISLDNNCTIIALCQLNRDSAKENKPSLSMLRDSGEIEQSARKVMFVWEENENYSICIEKNDSGGNRSIPVNYYKETQKFEEREARKDVRS